MRFVTEKIISYRPSEFNYFFDELEKLVSNDLLTLVEILVEEQVDDIVLMEVLEPIEWAYEKY